MKIAILGTSNSVMARAYVDALRQEHDVLNFSIGRVPAVFHIKTILSAAEKLAKCDVILLDHYVNDINTYLLRASNYLQHVESLYALLGRIGRPVLNILFPISDLAMRAESWYVEYVEKLSCSSGFSYVNLNQCSFSFSSFQDELHLKREISYAFGIYLLGCIENTKYQPPNITRETLLDYRLISARSVAKANHKNCELFSNSLVNLKYLPVNSSVVICDTNNDEAQLWHAISIGYFNKTDDVSGAQFVTRGATVPFSVGGQGYFHELLPAGVIATDELQLVPVKMGESYPSLMGRYGILTPSFCTPTFNFCDLLLARPKVL